MVVGRWGFSRELASPFQRSEEGREPSSDELALLICVLCFQVFFSFQRSRHRTVPGRQPRRKLTANGWGPQRSGACFRFPVRIQR